LVKRFHTRALELLNESSYDHERALVDRFLNRNQILTNRGWGVEADPDSMNAVENRKRIDRKFLKAEVRKRLDPTLSKPESLGGGAWRYTSQINKFTVTTTIDTGGIRPMAYSQAVLFQKKTLCRWISLLQWHGITSQTGWDTMQEDNVLSSVELLHQLVDRFLTALSTFPEDVNP
jgi:hypothetical protein